MTMSSPIPGLPDARPIPHFRGARKVPGQQARVERVRAAALSFRNDMLSGPKVRYLESFDLIRLPYASRYGLRNAFALEPVVPFLHIQNRVIIIQIDTSDGLRTVLVSPSDHERGDETPYFRRLRKAVPAVMQKLVVTRQATVLQVLARVGLLPEQIDYITYDHLHTQDVRRWLGTGNRPGLLPNARLIVQGREWDAARDLSPYQRDWYCPGGLDGVPDDKVIRIDGDVMAGCGLALIHTPGHTEGNQSIVAHTDEGLWVTSENGISVDAYEPLQSRVPGLARYASALGLEAIANGNTLENAVDQYISMVQEKTIAGPSMRDPRFPNVFPSSEMTPFVLFPGTRPSMSVGKISHGVIQRS